MNKLSLLMYRIGLADIDGVWVTPEIRPTRNSGHRFPRYSPHQGSQEKARRLRRIRGY